MTNVDKLYKEHPHLVEEYSSLTKEEMLEQLCAEVIDLLHMEERVQFFMSECTEGFSKTTYTIDSLKSMVSDQKEDEINEFCFFMTDEEEEKVDEREILERAKSYKEKHKFF